MNEDDLLQESFREAGRRHGYDEVSAQFSSFKEFKIKWQRSLDMAEFKVSDYLKGAEGGIMADFAHSLFQRMLGRASDPYPPSVRAWMASSEFVERNQPTYVRRSRNLSRSPKGEHLDLRDLYDTLVDKGLVDSGMDAYLSWTLRDNLRRVGYCSVLMRVIAVSSALDRETVPRFVPEYVLYHEILHLETGLTSDSPRHGPEFRRRERMFPRWKEAEAHLRCLASGR